MKDKYPPEGTLIDEIENKEYTLSIKGLENAMRQGVILESIALSCTPTMDLTVQFPCGIIGIIPKDEAVLPFPDRKEKDIAIISRVGKAVCFKVTGIRRTENGCIALLSRKAAQEECLKNKLSRLVPGDILNVRVTREEPFGAFVDIGCGIVSLISIDCISVSRISHPRDRFSSGDFLRAAVKCVDRMTGRIYMTMKELFGTWKENAARFEAGQTVTGTVRSIEDYGIFVELSPNLAGLAEYKEGVSVGERASVFIKSINPERMKIKLVLIDRAGNFSKPCPPVYFIPEEQTHISVFRYSPPECGKVIETVFETA